MRRECQHIASDQIWLISGDDYSFQSGKCINCNQTIVRETAPVGARYNWEDWRLTR